MIFTHTEGNPTSGSLWNGAEIEEGPHKKVCYRDRIESGDLGLVDQRGRWRSAVSLFPSLPAAACGFPGSACKSWRKG